MNWLKFFISSGLSLLIFSCTHTTQKISENSLNVPAFFIERNPTAEGVGQSKSYLQYFEKENYVNRVIKIRTLASHLQKLMSAQGHPRQYILENFIRDVNTEIDYLKLVERDIENLSPAWLPNEKSYEYSEKLISLERVIQSADVMFNIDSFTQKSGILEADQYEHNFYLNLLKQATSDLKNNYTKVRQLSTARNRSAVLGYVRAISNTARLHLHKLFNKNEKSDLKRVERYFLQLPYVTSPEMAKKSVSGEEYLFAKSYLAYSEGSDVGDIEGFETVKKTKLATYMGLEVIRHLYSQFN